LNDAFSLPLSGVMAAVAHYTEASPGWRGVSRSTLREPRERGKVDGQRLTAARLPGHLLEKDGSSSADAALDQPRHWIDDPALQNARHDTRAA
jgi:hypothetical protein